MDDLFVIILNIVCAIILIAHVIYNSIRKSRIKKAAEAAKSDPGQSDHSDERPIC